MTKIKKKISSAFSEFRCYDQEVHQKFLRTGVPSEDCVLQNPNELFAFCEWIAANEIRSYLEIGIWTGGLLRLLTSIFTFDKVAACDILGAQQYGLEISVPLEVDFFVGNSRSKEFVNWRAGLGNIDLVLIDGDHKYDAIKNDFLINLAFPHRYIAIHDITGANENTQDVKRFWDELSYGQKLEIVRPQPAVDKPDALMGIGIWSR